MHIVFARIIAALLWLEKRLAPIAKHPLGKVGIVLFVVMMSFANGQVVRAEEATGKSGPSLLETALLFIANIALTVAVVLSKLVVVIIQVLIPIMLYNKFSESPVVVSGWAIVRDTVNMFFVIVLIAIAFGTIFGNERFKWQKQMTRLMIFAIVINFSKTICGLVIDIGQVVMLTFANAIREIAAGNFVQMLGMGDVYSLSTSNQIFQSAATDSNATGAQAFDWFASALMSVFMMFIVLTTMLMLLGILMYRVVMLWILIVISPLAWFVGGAGDLIKSGAYADWWKKFICLVSIGPVLTFFLWLTLVVAGAGNISDSAGFVAAGSTDTAGGFLTQIFELNRLISFIIAIAMLYAGFDAANSTCSGAGLGFISDSMKGGPAGNSGARAAKAVAGLGARLGAKGARVGASGARAGYNKGVVPLAQYAGGKIDNSTLAQKTPLKYATSQGREGLYRNVAAKAGDNWIGQKIGRSATARAEKLGAERAALMASGMEKYKGDSGASKNDALRRMSQNAAMTPGGKREEQALMLDAMGDPDRMKELRASGTWDAMWKRHGKELETGAKGDKSMKAKVDAFKKANADIAGNWGDVKKDDVGSLSAFALASAKDDPKAQEQLKKLDSKFKRSKEEMKAARALDPNASEFMTADEAIRSGKMFGKDDDRTKAYTVGKGAIYEGMKPEELGRLPATAIAENLTEGLMTKNPALGGQLLASKDARVQAALQKRLNDAGSGGARNALLAGAGMKDGKMEDSKKFLEALQGNPAMMSYLSDDQFKDLGNEKMIALGSAFAENPKLLKDSIAQVKKDPKSNVRGRIQTILETAQNRKDGTKANDDALDTFNLHMKVVDGSPKTGNEQTTGSGQTQDYTFTVADLNEREDRKVNPQNYTPEAIAEQARVKLEQSDSDMRAQAQAAADTREQQREERRKVEEERGKAVWEQKQKEAADKLAAELKVKADADAAAAKAKAEADQQAAMAKAVQDAKDKKAKDFADMIDG